MLPDHSRRLSNASKLQYIAKDSLLQVEGEFKGGNNYIMDKKESVDQKI